MKLFFFVVFLVSLSVIVFQDFKHRAISWWILPAMLFSYLVYSTQPIEEIINSFFLNIIFIVVNLLVITIYFSLKESTLVNIVDTKMGLGDILFLVVCGFIFSLPNFILFFTFSLIISAIIAVTLKAQMKEKEIPLAGIMSALLLITSISNHSGSFDFARDEEWINSLFL